MIVFTQCLRLFGTVKNDQLSPPRHIYCIHPTREFRSHHHIRPSSSQAGTKILGSTASSASLLARIPSARGSQYSGHAGGPQAGGSGSQHAAPSGSVASGSALSGRVPSNSPPPPAMLGRATNNHRYDIVPASQPSFFVLWSLDFVARFCDFPIFFSRMQSHEFAWQCKRGTVVQARLFCYFCLSFMPSSHFSSIVTTFQSPVRGPAYRPCRSKASIANSKRRLFSSTNQTLSLSLCPPRSSVEVAWAAAWTWARALAAGTLRREFKLRRFPSL